MPTLIAPEKRPQTIEPSTKSLPSRGFAHPSIGWIQLTGSQQTGLTQLDLLSNAPEDYTPSDDALLLDVEHRLQAYLQGEAIDFSDIPLAPAGSDFQRAVWQVLQTIPRGQTRSYQWVAEQLGKPKAYRAVGNANGQNPIALIIPCHRVIQTNGALGGYTSGGLGTKTFLLGLEQVAIDDVPSSC